MKHLRAYESSIDIVSLDTSGSMAATHDKLEDRRLKYRVYIYDDGSGEVHNSSTNKVDFQFNSIEEFCEEYGLRNSVDKYNL